MNRLEFEKDARHNPERDVTGSLDILADGIMSMIDNPDPNNSGVVDHMPKADEPAAVEEPVEEVVEAVEEAPVETKKVKKIKWEGQEKELTEEEIIELAQKGFDYTQKTQKLAKERDELAPYVALANALKSRPDLASEIAAKLHGAPVKKEEPVSDDPVEQFKREIRNEFKRELEPMARQQAVDRIKMQVRMDPDFNTIHPMIVKMVQDAPPAIRQTLHMQLDQDPNAYLQVFEDFRSKIKKAPEPSKPAPTPVSKQTKAPILETASVGSESEESKAHKEKLEGISKAKAKALRSGKTKDLADWLVGSGAIDHLL